MFVVYVIRKYASCDGIKLIFFGSFLFGILGNKVSIFCVSLDEFLVWDYFWRILRNFGFWV